MDMTGEQLIALPQQATWDALNDTAVLMDCIPGCDSMEKQSDTEYLLTMTAKVGPVSAKFKGKMTLSDVHAPHAPLPISAGPRQAVPPLARLLNAAKNCSAVFLATPSISRAPTCASLPPIIALTT